MAITDYKNYNYINYAPEEELTIIHGMGFDITIDRGFGCRYFNTVCIGSSVEDGMFEESIMFIVALYPEMLWDVNRDLNEMINEVALRGYVDFA